MMFFRLECIGFNNIRAHVGIFRGMRNIFIQYSNFTCQESAILSIRSWYQSDIMNGRHQNQSVQAPPPLFLHSGHALLTSLVDFLFRPAPLKVSIETAVENYYRINNSCHPIRVEWFPDKSMKILKFSNCHEIFPLSIIVLKFMSSFVLRCGQQC